MNCNDFRQQLEAAIEARTGSLSDLQAHAAQCPHCVGAWDEYQLLETAIQRWKPLREPVDFTDRVLAQWRLEPVEQPAMAPLEDASSTVVRAVRSDDSEDAATSVIDRRTSEERGQQRFAVATMAMVLVTVAVMFHRQHRSQLPEVAKQEASIAVALAPPAQHAELKDIISDAKSAWWGLARSTAERTSGLSVFVPELSMPSNLSNSLPKPKPNPMEAQEDEDDSELTPVPKELRRAFEFLINAAEAGEATTT